MLGGLDFTVLASGITYSRLLQTLVSLKNYCWKSRGYVPIAFDDNAFNHCMRNLPTASLKGLSLQLYYTMSQKMTLILHPIRSTHINRFW